MICFGIAHVIKHDPVHPACKGFPDFGNIPCLNLYLKSVSPSVPVLFVTAALIPPAASIWLSFIITIS
jgi:hypothetical protein